MTTATSVKKENARLNIFKGVVNKEKGINPNMEVGHLYHCKNDVDELAALGALIGLNPNWMQNKMNGLAHYDLWGVPLKKAKMMFRIVTHEEIIEDLTRIGESVKKELDSLKLSVLTEYRDNDFIIKNIGYVSFASKSKGRGRLRKGLKEVELYRYSGGGWHIEGKSKFDEIASEITSGRVDGDALMWWVKEHCDHKGGKNKGIY